MKTAVKLRFDLGGIGGRRDHVDREVVLGNGAECAHLSQSNRGLCPKPSVAYPPA